MMKYKLLLIFAAVAMVFGNNVKAAEQNDTIYNPTIVFSGMPKK